MAPLLLRLDRAGDLLDLSESSVKRLVKTGALPAVKVAGATRVRVADLQTYVEQLPTATDLGQGARVQLTAGREQA